MGILLYLYADVSVLELDTKLFDTEGIRKSYTEH